MVVKRFINNSILSQTKSTIGVWDGNVIEVEFSTPNWLDLTALKMVKSTIPAIDTINARAATEKISKRLFEFN